MNTTNALAIIDHLADLAGGAVTKTAEYVKPMAVELLTEISRRGLYQLIFLVVIALGSIGSLMWCLRAISKALTILEKDVNNNPAAVTSVASVLIGFISLAALVICIFRIPRPLGEMAAPMATLLNK